MTKMSKLLISTDKGKRSENYGRKATGLTHYRYGSRATKGYSMIINLRRFIFDVRYFLCLIRNLPNKY
jgi:hypothetical protein